MEENWIANPMCSVGTISVFHFMSRCARMVPTKTLVQTHHYKTQYLSIATPQGINPVDVMSLAFIENPSRAI